MSDVVVIGSGAAGLAAALAAAAEGARVTVLEATATFGGTTALSGGVSWLPGNRFGAADDSHEAATTYLAELGIGDTDPDLIEQFVLDAPRVADLVAASTPLQWEPLPYPDYHSERPGGRTGGRSLEPRPLDLPAVIRDQIRAPLSWRLPVTYREVVHGEVSRHVIEQRQADGTLVMGSAMIGAFLASLRDLGVDLHVGVRALELRTDDGRVTGVTTDGGDVQGAVVLATGGFERDPALARSFLRAPAEGLTGAPGARGDGLRMAMRVGAGLGNMSEAWWCPSMHIPGDTIDGEPLHRLVLDERSRPGSLLVDSRGRRFTDESQNYNDVGRAMHAFDAGAFGFVCDPSWLVIDHTYRTTYTLGPLLRGEPDPDWLFTAPDLPALAVEMDVPADALVATVERFNEHAARGEDPEFGRGGTAYDRFVGDPRAEHPNLRPLDAGPYHAVKIRPGLLGTKGGPRIDRDGRVLDLDGRPLAGLFGAGNVTASPFGMAYPGAGGTIGPALVFGTRAGEAAAHG